MIHGITKTALLGACLWAGALASAAPQEPQPTEEPQKSEEEAAQETGKARGGLRLKNQRGVQTKREAGPGLVRGRNQEGAETQPSTEGEAPAPQAGDRAATTQTPGARVQNTARRQGAQEQGAASETAKPDPRRMRGASGAIKPPSRRALANKMVADVKTHRLRMARLDRLADIFKRQGSARKLASVEQLSTREVNRYEAAMQTYQRGLGEKTFKMIRDRVGTDASEKGGGGGARNDRASSGDTAPEGGAARNAEGQPIRRAGSRSDRDDG